MAHSQHSGDTRDDGGVGAAIGRGAAVIFALSILDKLLAVAKEMLTAARFGVEAQMDAFNIAYAFPGIVNLLFQSACVSALVPLVVTWRQNEASDGPSRDKILTVLYVSVLFFALLAVACRALSPWVIGLAGYGFHPDTLALSISMENWLVWLILLEGACLIQGALLQSWKRFAVLTLAQTLINLAIIGFLAAAPGLGIQGMILGFLAGTLLKAVALTAGLKGMGIGLFRPFRPDFAALGDYVRLAAPFLGSALVANSNVLIDQSMSTSLPEGGVAVLRYAYRVNDLPLQLMVIALARAVFPFVSEQAARGDRKGLTGVFRLSVAAIMLIALPVTAYVLVFADEIVTVLLRRGAFDAHAAGQTALTLRCYSVGLVFHAYTFINAAFFSALRLGSVLLRLGVATLAMNVLFNWLFLRLLEGPHAIALSTTVTMALVSLVFVHLLSARLEPQAMSGLWREGLLVGLVSLAAAGACAGLRKLGEGLGLPEAAVLALLTFPYLGISLCLLYRLRTGETGQVVEAVLMWAARRRKKS